MFPAHIRFLVLMTALLLASCDAVDLPKACRTEGGLRDLMAAKAGVKRAEAAVIHARMMGPSTDTGIARPPDFEPDPVAARAVRTLGQARKNLRDAVARCRAG